MSTTCYLGATSVRSYSKGHSTDLPISPWTQWKCWRLWSSRRRMCRITTTVDWLGKSSTATSSSNVSSAPTVRTSPPPPGPGPSGRGWSNWCADRAVTSSCIPNDESCYRPSADGTISVVSPETMIALPTVHWTCSAYVSCAQEIAVLRPTSV